MINVMKLGGSAGTEYAAALRDLAGHIQRGERWVLVHGTSAAANELAERVGYTVQTITSPNGHTSRYTDARMIEVYSMAAASVNQRITATLTGYGIRAVGLAGPTIISAHRKKAIRAVRDGRLVVIHDDYSGTISGVASDVLLSLLDAGLTPVVAPVAMGDEFERLNVDGDLVAATIAKELNAETLIILSNVPGLLRDVSEPASIVSRIPLRELSAYEPLAAGRMKKKLLAAQEAGVSEVILADGRSDAPIGAALSGAGTHIFREVVYAEHPA